MRDNDLYTAVRKTLVDLVKLRYAEPLGYKLRYQNTQEGRPSEPTVYYFKVGDKRYGWPKIRQRWNVALARMVQVQEQPMETTLQISATMNGQSMAPDAWTPSDVLNMIASVMQSVDFIEAIGKLGLQVLRVQEIRNPIVKSDTDQWEEQPSFDIVFKHSHIYEDSQPIISAFEFDVLAVPDII